MEYPRRSYWHDTAEGIKKHAAENVDLKNKKFDILIIGAGITGLTTAYLLKDCGFNIGIIEATKSGYGVTGYTTAKITIQHDLFYDYLINSFSMEEAKQYLKANEEGIKLIKRIIDENNIQCDYKEQTAYVYAASVNEVEDLKKELKAYEKLGIDGFYTDTVPIPNKAYGAKKTYLIEEPVAAAIGAGLDITKPSGHMVIDMGGGTTDIAVISLGGIVVSRSIKVAGDKCDDAIVRYVRKKYNVMIGLRSAEELKIKIGTVFPVEEEKFMEVRGRNLVTGLPVNLTISSSDSMEAMEETITTIADAVHSVLEKTPPELAADISEKGIVMTGGGCLIHGMDKLLEKRTGLKVTIAEDAVSCVAKGTGQSLYLNLKMHWLKGLQS
jgi:MreB/Mrl family cell shape determining protein